jgi:hypothetical protein
MFSSHGIRVSVTKKKSVVFISGKLCVGVFLTFLVLVDVHPSVPRSNLLKFDDRMLRTTEVRFPVESPELHPSNDRIRLDSSREWNVSHSISHHEVTSRVDSLVFLERIVSLPPVSNSDLTRETNDVVLSESILPQEEPRLRQISRIHRIRGVPSILDKRSQTVDSNLHLIVVGNDVSPLDIVVSRRSPREEVPEELEHDVDYVGIKD